MFKRLLWAHSGLLSLIRQRPLWRLETLRQSLYEPHEWLLWVKAANQLRSNLTLPVRSDASYNNLDAKIRWFTSVYRHGVFVIHSKRYLLIH
jgi:hypothetical protein